MSLTKNSLIGLLLIFFLVDRALKQLALLMSPVVSGDFFYFAPAINKAGPFSILLPRAFILAVAGLALVWLTHLVVVNFKKSQIYILAGAGLMLIGGFSNIFDRLMLGGVIDIWQVALPVGFSFNLSDVYLLIGLATIIWFYRRKVVKISGS